MSFWRKFRHWLYWTLSKWQFSAQPVRTTSKWQHLCFSGCNIDQLVFSNIANEAQIRGRRMGRAPPEYFGCQKKLWRATPSSESASLCLPCWTSTTLTANGCISVLAVETFANYLRLPNPHQGVSRRCRGRHCGGWCPSVCLVDRIA